MVGGLYIYAKERQWVALKAWNSNHTYVDTSMISIGSSKHDSMGLSSLSASNENIILIDG